MCIARLASQQKISRNANEVTAALHDKAAIETAAFSQQEQEEKAARHSREAQKRPYEAAAYPAKRSNFCPTPLASPISDTSTIPCRDFAAGRCTQGSACRFGHFIAQRPGEVQRNSAPATSYTATAHSNHTASQQ